MQSQFTDRLNWIDALRGFTMFSVVLVHVLVQSFGVDQTQSALCILRGSFTLPLFFLVSGFFLFRPIAEWNRPRITMALKRRTIALLLGTIIIATIYYAGRSGIDPFLWLPHADFNYFWFTISLFQMFIAYLLVVGIAKITRPWVFWTIAAIVSIGSFIWMGFFYKGPWYSWIYSAKTLEFTPFFVMGMLIRRFSERFFQLLENPYTLMVFFLTFCGSIFIAYIAPKKLDIINQLHLVGLFQLVFARVSGALLVLNIFYIYRSYFNRDTRFVNQWLHIGRRTLDIYLLHYFFLPWMRWVGPYLKHNNTLIQELVAGGIVALAVIICCLGVSAITRRCPGIRLLFGAKGPITYKSKPDIY